MESSPKSTRKQKQSGGIYNKPINILGTKNAKNLIEPVNIEAEYRTQQPNQNQST